VHVLHGGRNIRLWTTDAYTNRLSTQKKVFEAHNKLVKTAPDMIVSVSRVDDVREKMETSVFPNKVYPLVARCLAPTGLKSKYVVNASSLEHDIAQAFCRE
jgi:hypothetical protein